MDALDYSNGFRSGRPRNDPWDVNNLRRELLKAFAGFSAKPKRSHIITGQWGAGAFAASHSVMQKTDFLQLKLLLQWMAAAACDHSRITFTYMDERNPDLVETMDQFKTLVKTANRHRTRVSAVWNLLQTWLIQNSRTQSPNISPVTACIRGLANSI
jgi:hypothetical protein